jgi:tRNA 2-thiouridine synthesizing protein C
VTKRFLFIHRRPPHGTLYAQEALDVVLVASAFDQQVSLAFLDDGVYQLVRQQDTRGTGTKDFAPAFRALADHDVKHVYVEQESLAERGLNENDLLLPVQLISREATAALLLTHDVLFNF